MPTALAGLGLVLCLGCEVERESAVEAIERQRPLEVEAEAVEVEESGTVPCQDYPEAGSEGPFRLTSSGSIVPPRRISSEQPDIASLGLEMSEVGALLAEVVVSEAGSVDSVKVVRSSHPEIDRVSVEWLARSRFEPATRDGRPVSVCIVLTIWPHR